jgi:hypothetical protein
MSSERTLKAITDEKKTIMSKASPLSDDDCIVLDRLNAELEEKTQSMLQAKNGNTDNDKIRNITRKMKFSAKQVTTYKTYLCNLKKRPEGEMMSKTRNRDDEIARVEKIITKHSKRLRGPDDQ